MKNYIVIAILLLFGAIPMKGQNHDIHIYLHNGDIHSFFYERADSITFNDFGKQKIWTIDSIYSVKISEIDIVRFGERTLPIAFYEENFSGWSDVLFCNNGMVAFHTDKTEHEPEKSLILVPDDTYGLICSYVKYDENSYPYLITFNDDVIYISEDEKGNPMYTMTQGDSLVLQFGGTLSNNNFNEAKNIVKRSWGENNWQRNTIAVCKILTGLVESAGGGLMILGSGVGEIVTGGVSTPLSVQGIIVGGMAIVGGKNMMQSGFETIFVPAANSSKGVDNYGKQTILNIGEEVIINGLKWEKTQRFLLEHLPNDAMYYLVDTPKDSKWTSWTFWGGLTLDALDAKFGETITKADKMIDLYKKGNVITGIAKNITAFSATVRGYVSPELTYGLDGEEIEVEYGIIVKGNGKNYTRKISNERGGLIEFNVENLSPSCEYTYFTYVWDKTNAILRYGTEKSFTTLSLPIATTGDCSNVTKTSAMVSCIYENVPEDGVCGVEYTWSDGSISKNIGRVNGKQTISLNNLKPMTTYTYCAFIEAYGQTYYGENKTFTTNSIDCSVALSNFKVLKSQYKEDAFINEGVKYDYRFDVSITATLDTKDISYIKDWGYVYEDPNGHKKEISLLQFGKKYTDTRYSYFRNTAHSTARLYGYVYIVGSEAPIYGEVHDYPLDHYMPIATTGNYSNVTKNSVTVSCSYENVPDGGVCGVEYSWDEGTHKQAANNSDGTQTISLSGLKSGTTYTYRAYIDDNGQTYYGEDKTFTTEVEYPDLSGTWTCTEYKDNGEILETSTLILKSDKTATTTSSAMPSDIVGNWSVSADGKASIFFDRSTNVALIMYQIRGEVNNISSPTRIEGTSMRGRVAHTTSREWVNYYRVVLTR